MIVLAEYYSPQPAFVTVHYTHPPRPVMTQVSLASRLDFTELSASSPIVRATPGFIAMVDGGTTTDLLAAPHYAPPSLRGDALTEVVFQALTENCSARYVVNQFLTSGTGFLDPTPPRAIRVLYRAADHRVPYTHTVTVFPGGRAVSTDEAVHDATAHATRYGLDTSTLTVEVQTFPTLLDEHRRLAPAGDGHA
jgi:hypothetical protein